MKFHRESPWLSILSWLNLKANKDYFSYECAVMSGAQRISCAVMSRALCSSCAVMCTDMMMRSASPCLCTWQVSVKSWAVCNIIILSVGIVERDKIVSRWDSLGSVERNKIVSRWDSLGTHSDTDSLSLSLSTLPTLRPPDACSSKHKDFISLSTLSRKSLSPDSSKKPYTLYTLSTLSTLS